MGLARPRARLGEEGSVIARSRHSRRRLVGGRPSTPCLVLQCTVRTHGYLGVGGSGIPVVVLTLVGNRSFGCHGEELDSRADDVLRPGLGLSGRGEELLPCLIQC